MERVITVAGVLVAMMLAITSGWAEEPAKEAGDNASESGKNEIPICKKPVPIDVDISPEFIEKNRGSEQDGNEVLGGNRVEALQKYEVAKRLEYAIACELERQGYVAAKPIKVMGNVTDFRLRSPEVLFLPLTRAMAGEDKLAVKIDVLVPGDDKPYQFAASDSTGRAGFRKTAPSQRLNYLVKNITKEVIGKIIKTGLFKEPYATSPGDQFASMGEAINKGNREVLSRITKALSKQKEPVDVAALDRVADRIYNSQAESDGGMADTLAHMCKLLGKSGNGKYKQMLREISETATHKTLRKYAALAASSLPDTNEKPYSPVKGQAGEPLNKPGT